MGSQVIVTCSPADPVYERVGSLNHRHLPLKLELSNSSHTYTTLKSEEGSYVCKSQYVLS